MNKTDDEKLTDIVMGEAVMALLNGKGPISNAALIVRLQSMAETEATPARRKACERAAAEVRAIIAAFHPNRTMKRDNARQLQGTEGQPDDQKKH